MLKTRSAPEKAGSRERRQGPSRARLFARARVQQAADPVDRTMTATLSRRYKLCYAAEIRNKKNGFRDREATIEHPNDEKSQHQRGQLGRVGLGVALELSQIRIRGNPGRTTALGDPARFYHLAERMGPP